MRSTYTLIAAYLGLFVGLVDSNAVNLALPALRTEFGGGVSAAQWAADAYNVAFAAVLLTAGAAGDRFGRRRLLRLGLGTFAAASSAALGPVIGGLLTDTLGWRYIFWLNVPVCLAALAMSYRLLSESRDPDAHRTDIPGQLFAMASLATLTLLLVEGRAVGALKAAALLVLLAVTAAVFVWWQRRAPEPTIPADLAHNRQLGVGLAATFAMTFGVYALMWLNSLGFQQQRGASAIATALWFLPLPLAYLALIPVVTRVARRTGPRLPMTVGLSLMGAGILAYAAVGPEADIRIITAIFVIVGAGLAFNTGPAVTMVLSAVPVHRAGLASGLANLARLIGVTMGIAVVGTVLAVAGMRTALLAGGIVEIAGAVVAYSPRAKEVCHA